MKRQLRTKCNFRYRLLFYLDSLSFSYPQEQNRPEKFSTGESQVLLSEKKRKSSLVGDLLKEDSGSLNRSMRVFCWITEEHQESYSLRHPLQRKSIHILFGRIRYLIISSEEEYDQIYLCDIIIGFWICVSYSEIWYV